MVTTSSHVQALLKEGLTNQWSVVPGQSHDVLKKRASDSMLRLHDRKLQAASAARKIRESLHAIMDMPVKHGQSTLHAEASTSMVDRLQESASSSRVDQSQESASSSSAVVELANNSKSARSIAANCKKLQELNAR
jgi:hypothetical protein